MKKTNILEKIKTNFSFVLGEKPNYELFNKIFENNFIKNNYSKIKNSGFIRGKGKTKNEVKIKYNFIINAKAENIYNDKDNVYIFTYDHLIRNGLLLELNKNFFQFNLFKFRRTFENAINEININRQNLDKIVNDIGLEFINNLSILYVKIKDLNYLILSEQLYGEAKSISQTELNNFIENSISMVSTKTSDIVGRYYEDSILLYFLKHSKINHENILPRLLFYMDFIVFKYDNNSIDIDFIPFNKFYGEKEAYNEMDYSFYTSKQIIIPMSSLKYQIFFNTFIYNYKDNSILKDIDNDQIIFPEKTLTFFEMKNHLDRNGSNNKIIDLKDLKSNIQTFISKLPIFMGLYKSKNFINKTCNNINFVFFYDQDKGKIDDTIEAKNMIKEIIDEKFKNTNIEIKIQIIFGSKEIQSINYLELFLENNKFKEELKKTNEKLRKLEHEMEIMKKYLPKDLSMSDEQEKKKLQIELDEKQMKIKEEIDKHKKNFEGTKLKIFERAMAEPELMKYINENDEHIKIIEKLSKKLIKNDKIKTTFDEETIKKFASKLVKKVLIKLKIKE